MVNESLGIVVVVGLIAGWLAGQMAGGTGFGIIGDLVIGILGALVGNWLLPQLGIHLGTDLVAAIVAPVTSRSLACASSFGCSTAA